MSSAISFLALDVVRNCDIRTDHADAVDGALNGFEHRGRYDLLVLSQEALSEHEYGIR